MYTSDSYETKSIRDIISDGDLLYSTKPFDPLRLRPLITNTIILQSCIDKYREICSHENINEQIDYRISLNIRLWALAFGLKLGAFLQDGLNPDSIVVHTEISWCIDNPRQRMEIINKLDKVIAETEYYYLNRKHIGCDGIPNYFSDRLFTFDYDDQNIILMTEDLIKMYLCNNWDELNPISDLRYPLYSSQFMHLFKVGEEMNRRRNNGVLNGSVVNNKVRE